MIALALQALRVGVCVVAAEFLTVLLISAGMIVAGDLPLAPSHYIVISLIILALLGAYFGYRSYTPTAVVTGVVAGLVVSIVIAVMLAPNVDSPTGATWWRPLLSVLAGCAAAIVGFGISATLRARRRE
jgi:hypothetical protein